jgi:predicted PurR-regulated permease PerM
MAAKRESAGPVLTPAPPRFGIGWSDQSVRLLVLAAGVAVMLWLARGVIGPFVVAGILAYAFSPVVSAVQRRTRLPRLVVVGVGYMLVLGVVAVVAYIAAERAGKELTDLSSGGHDVISSALHKLLGNTVVIAGNTYSVEDLAAQIRSAFLGLVNSPTSAVQMAERAVAIGLQVILCLIITFYLLLDGHRFGQFALRFLDREQRVGTLRIAERIHVVLGRWLRGQLLLMVLVTAVFYIILGPILHVPFALALAILSGVHDPRGPCRVLSRAPGRRPGGHAPRDRSGGAPPPGCHDLRRPGRIGHVGRSGRAARRSRRRGDQRDTA